MMTKKLPSTFSATVKLKIFGTSCSCWSSWSVSLTSLTLSCVEISLSPSLATTSTLQCSFHSSSFLTPTTVTTPVSVSISNGTEKKCRNKIISLFQPPKFIIHIFVIHKKTYKIVQKSNYQIRKRILIFNFNRFLKDWNRGIDKNTGKNQSIFHLPFNS